MSSIRVLRIIARMNVGGPAFEISTLADGLDPDRFEQRLLVGDVEEGEEDFLALRAPHLEATHIRGLRRAPDPIGDSRALAALVREVREFRPHIVHTHTAKAGVLGRSAAMIGGARTRVHTFHGHLLYGIVSPWMTRTAIAVERFYARHTTRLIAGGERVRDELLAAGIGRQDQYVVVPPGVDLPEPPTRHEARARLGLGDDERVVAFVARLTRQKRPDRFAEVARQVSASRPDVRFVIAGEGELLSDLRTGLASLGDRVRFLGWRGDVETVYAAADMVLLTSDNEGMPVSLMEAAWVGCPAVTTHVGSTDEVVVDGATGRVVAADVAELAEATLELCGDAELRHRLGSAARVRARRQFGHQRLVDHTAELYEELATRASRPHPV